MFTYNKKLKDYSRKLRNNMTDAEKMLWLKIRAKQLQGYQFYRQRIIGNYIVDFYCPKAKLVIELDGGQHYQDQGARNDQIRDEFIKSLGIKVIRFSDLDVMKNLNGVIEEIFVNLQSPSVPL
ncbi:MAG: endonuclease domain-containing protein [bacterium]|nr:endonuclease domain-containing protein [bacterium]